ncbi:hypothetical protein [Clostridium manihotivorum]|uniref:Uncharacterized protein n=1 Tax=Clostridium manihotivorum TaxID=2320868 RepID=A0A410DVN2_9CLOT|nr:hypothetical protein [Clostridium manihotivorum]QAA33125.1 hypothetical protein C1I91_16600 [Clostridium manihotivorum]
MKYNRGLMNQVFVLLGALGYLGLAYLPIEFKSIFFIASTFVTIVYLAQSIRKGYGKLHIVMSLLALLLFISLFIHYLVICKYIELSYVDNYTYVFSTIAFVSMFIIAAVNYFKNVGKRESFFMKILIIILIILLILLLILVVLKRYNFLPN